jgi:hypothetical protein
VDAHPVLRGTAARGIQEIVHPHRITADSGHDDRHGVYSITANCSVLWDFIESGQPWDRERVPVPHRLQWALWALLAVELLWAIWLGTILTGATPCSGPICTVATLHYHAAALLACGVFCAVALVGLIPTTRGFSRCNGIEVSGLAVASAAGGASLLGIAALIVGALIAFFLLATFVLASTATSRRETDHARTGTPFPIAFTEDARPSRARRVERPDQ